MLSLSIGYGVINPIRIPIRREPDKESHKNDKESIRLQGLDKSDKIFDKIYDKGSDKIFDSIFDKGSGKKDYDNKQEEKKTISWFCLPHNPQ